MRFLRPPHRRESPQNDGRQDRRARQDDLRLVGIRSASRHPSIRRRSCSSARLRRVPTDSRRDLREIGEVDYVIHAAAETHVDNSIIDPLPFLQSNVIGTHHLLMWMRSLKTLRRAFLVSTDEVYGPAQFGDDVAGFDEQAPFRPANPYAAAKAGGECVAMAYANTYKLPITIVNTMNLVGERQHHEKMVPKCIRAALLGELLMIHADPTRTFSGTRFYLHCRTYAHALNFLIDFDQKPGLDSPSEIQQHGMPRKIHVCGEREIRTSISRR